MISMRAMKWIDHWVGLPVCTALAVLCALRRRRPLAEPRTIVVTKFFGLGSMLLAAPMVQALRRRYPAARVIFLTFSGNRRLAEMLGLADEIRTVRQTAAGFLSDTVRVLFHLRRFRLDVFIDLEFYSKYVTMLCALSGARARIGYHLASFWRTGIYTHPVFFNHRLHITRLYAEIARQLGAEVADRRPPRAPVPEEARQRLYGLYGAQGIGGPRIGVNVNASDLAFCRRWPLENFARLVERLVAELGLAVILTGSASEAAYTEQCRAQVDPRYRPRVFNLAGKMDFEMLLAFFEDVPLLITNDSGPLHLAAGQGCSTLTVWGAGDPAMYGPPGDNHSFVYLDYACSPCMYIYRTPAGHFCGGAAPCLAGISPEMVWEEFLAREARGLAARAMAMGHG
jgi:ADP-heptose:LPS heptosyltransferase